MELSLPIRDSMLHSASQIARKSTEEWTGKSFYCPSCGLHLAAFSPGTRVYDFYSAACGEKFQLKSSSHSLSHSILGSEYKTTLQSIMDGVHPSLFLLRYDRQEWKVKDFSVIHRACITRSCIIPRRPLGQAARRAGWQGCRISLQEVPKLGQIEVVTEGVAREKAEVMLQWKRSDSLLRTRPSFRGWLADTLTCVERLPSTFALDDVYAFEKELMEKHPENHNIRPKIRQQLQVLRDLGLVKFISPGLYQYAANNSGV
jgi:type II restriction enzyme